MKIFYLRDKKRNPVACVAWDYGNAKIKFGISTHNPLDHYNKEVGRALAVGRFGFQPHTLDLALPSMAVGVSTLLGIIVNEGNFPTRTRKAAALWLKNPPKPKTRKSRAA